MAEMQHQAPQRGSGMRGSEGKDRTAANSAPQNVAHGNWLQLQRTMGNRMVGELLQKGMQLTAAPPTIGVQRAPGLPTRKDLLTEGLKAGKKLRGKSAWAKLTDALDAYELLGDTDYRAQKEQLQKIEVIIREWRASYDQRETSKKLKKQDPAKLLKVESILASIQQRRIVIQEAETPSTSGREDRRRREAVGEWSSPMRKDVELKEEKKEMRAAVTLKDYLLGLGYKIDRNYLSLSKRELAHVSWKAHIGSGDATQRLAIAQAVSPLLMSWEVSHKFDFTTTEGPIDKFLTVYPTETEEDWELIVNMLESAVSGFATVDVSGDMPVGETGKVHMRHGQNTPLNPDMLAGLDVREEGSIGSYKQYVGSAVRGGGLPLLISDQTMFFSKTMEAPAALTPQYVYMAIVVDGRIVPDKREEANPANVPLPPGIKKFERTK